MNNRNFLSSHLEEVEIETHTVCNARCIYCAYPAMRKSVGDKRMDWELFEKVVRELIFAEGTLKRVHLHHVNEPLLDKQVEQRIELLRHLHNDIEVGFSTNAMLLTPERSKQLINAGLNLAYVTIPSGDPAEYRRIMGVKVDVDRVLDNLEAFLEQAEGVARVVLRSPVGFDDRLSAIPQTHPWITVEEMTLMQRLGETKISQHESHDQAFKPIPCSLPWIFRSLIIAYNGDIPLCCNDQRHQFIIDSVREKSVGEVWNSERYAAVRRWMCNVERPADFLCNKCEFGNSGIR